MQQIFVLSFCVSLIFAIMSWGIQIYVARKLNQKGVHTGRFYTTGGAILTLVRGWEYADELQIREVMIAWTLVFALTVAAGIVVLVTISSIPRPPR